MKGLGKKIKSTSGNSSMEIIIWFSIIMILVTVVFCINVGSRNNNTINDNTNHIVNTDTILENQNNIIKDEEIKVPVTQNITINNIKNDKNDSILHDFNINLLSDLTSTTLIALFGFFIGKITKKRKFY